MRFLIIFVFLLSNSYANEVIDIKNLVINKELKKYDSLTFLDSENNQVSLDSFNGNLILINFWATWCAPCVRELPYFEIVNREYKDKNIKVILVSLDFPSEIKSKLSPYLYKNNIKSDVILLDDPNISTWVPKVHENWDGGIPATLIVNSSNYNFYPNPFEKEDLIFEINKIHPFPDK